MAITAPSDCSFPQSRARLTCHRNHPQQPLPRGIKNSSPHPHHPISNAPSPAATATLQPCGPVCASIMTPPNASAITTGPGVAKYTPPLRPGIGRSSKATPVYITIPPSRGTGGCKKKPLSNTKCGRAVREQPPVRSRLVLHIRPGKCDKRNGGGGGGAGLAGRQPGVAIQVCSRTRGSPSVASKPWSKRERPFREVPRLNACARACGN